MEQIKQSCCLLLLPLLVAANTVHFTNSKSQLESSLRSFDSDATVKTYQLEVPGAQPITIIETDPPKKQRESKQVNERRTKDYIVPGSNQDRDYEPDEPLPKKTVYSPELLNKFLKEYADKIKNADPKIKERLQQLETSTDVVDRAYQKNKISEKIDIHVQSDDVKKSWGAFDNRRHKYPQEENDGWVTLEAIPWTKSKISKWQANTHKIKPLNTYDRDPSYGDRYPPSNYGRPDPEKDFFDRPEFDEHKPSYGPQNNNDWPSEHSARPSWAKPISSNKPSFHSESPRPHHHRPDCNHEEHDSNGYFDDNRRVSYYHYDHDGIITDGRPSNFPSTSSGHRFKDMLFSRPTEVVYTDFPKQDHPISHPANGNGEWVLLSTTKGYQFPNKRQRSLSFTPEPVTAHTAIKLTVLPPVNASTENMTTSHGGMLEVQPSFHSVDESRKLHELQKRNATKLRRLKVRGIVAQNSPDSTAVMAAVGAGLVPATMAMIMPMMMGRRKRDAFKEYFNQISGPNVVTQHPNLAFESTIQRTMK